MAIFRPVDKAQRRTERPPRETYGKILSLGNVDGLDAMGSW